MKKLKFLSIFVPFNTRVRMKAVIDEKIPYLRDALASMGVEVVALPGSAITKDDLMDAQALFVRTRTRCDAALLEGTAVRFVGTATIGYDHIDAGSCSANGIYWTNAAGCNAGAVLQYVQSVIYSWARDFGRDIAGLTLGVVGLGEIGSRVAAWAAGVGMRVIANDPPKAAIGHEGLVPLGQVAAECDIITFHPTLNVDGEYRSWHLADSGFFASLKHCKLFVNASRGAVVDNAALLQALETGKVECAAIDVWENEPDISIPLLNNVYIATPHIAGYSAEGKMNATSIVLREFAHYIGYAGEIPVLRLAAPEHQRVKAACESEALLSIYSPLEDTVALKKAPWDFEKLRNNYRLRREPVAYSIEINGNVD